MGGLVRAEGYRLVRDRSFWAMLAVAVGAYLLMLSGGHHLEAPGRDVLGGILGGTAAASLMVAGVYGGLSLGRDFEGRTLARPVEAGASRGRVLLAKAASLLAAMDALILAFPLMAVVWCTVANGWGGAVDGGEALAFAAKLVALALLGAAIASVSFAAACCFRAAAPAIIVPLILTLASFLTLGAADASGIAGLLPFDALWLVATGALSPVRGALLGAVWCAALLAAGFLAVRRAELR